MGKKAEIIYCKCEKCNRSFILFNGIGECPNGHFDMERITVMKGFTITITQNMLDRCESIGEDTNG